MREDMNNTDGNVVADDWRRFSSLSRMSNHWDRPGWNGGRSAYYWYLTFNNPALLLLTRRCQEQLDGLEMDLVANRWLHLSLTRLAWADEMSPGDAVFAAEEAGSRVGDVPQCTLQIGPVAGSSGAVRLSVEPWKSIGKIRDALGDPQPERDGSAPPKPFLPHITIAYNNHDRPARPVIDAVAQARSLAKVAVEVHEVALVEVRRVGAAYEWTTVKELPLGGGPPRR